MELIWRNLRAVISWKLLLPVLSLLLGLPGVFLFSIFSIMFIYSPIMQNHLRKFTVQYFTNNCQKEYKEEHGPLIMN